MKHFLKFAIVFSILAALIVTVTGLNLKESGEENETLDMVEIQTIESETKPEVETLTLGSQQLSAFEAEAVKAVRCCEDIYAAAEKGAALNVVLSHETVSQLVYALGENGYSAVDYFGRLNMQNTQSFEEFGAALNAGSNAELTYYVVYGDGRVDAYRILYNEGKAAAVITSIEWNDSAKPEAYYTRQYPLYELKYTDKGWLIANRNAPMTPEEEEEYQQEYTSSYLFMRAAPYDETKAALCDRYVGNIGYGENNLFTCSWDSDNFGDLDFNSLYPILHQIYYGSVPITADNATSIAGFQLIQDTNMHVVPYEQFERVTSHFFNVSPETLQSRAENSSSYGGYFMLGLSDMHFNVSPRYPVPDLVDYWDNSDGSITLRVDAVYPWYGTDRAFTHEVTVMETDDGFVYLSNKLIENEGNILPPMTLQRVREAEISMLK